MANWAVRLILPMTVRERGLSVKDIMRINYCSMVTKYCNASTVFVKSDNSVEKYDESMFE